MTITFQFPKETVSSTLELSKRRETERCQPFGSILSIGSCTQLKPPQLPDTGMK